MRIGCLNKLGLTDLQNLLVYKNILKNIHTIDYQRGELTAGNPQVMSILLSCELVQAQVPNTNVSVCGACSKHLSTRAKWACNHGGIWYSTSPKKNNKQTKSRIWIYINHIDRMTWLTWTKSWRESPTMLQCHPKHQTLDRKHQVRRHTPWPDSCLDALALPQSPLF